MICKVDAKRAISIEFVPGQLQRDPLKDRNQHTGSRIRIEMRRPPSFALRLADHRRQYLDCLRHACQSFAFQSRIGQALGPELNREPAPFPFQWISQAKNKRLGQPGQTGVEIRSGQRVFHAPPLHGMPFRSDRHHHIGLALEVSVDGAGTETGFGDDVLHRGGMKPFARKAGQRRIEHALALRAGARRGDPRHGALPPARYDRSCSPACRGFGAHHPGTILVGAEIAQQRKSAFAQERGQFLRQQAKSPGFAGTIDLGDDFIRADKGDRAVQHPFMDIGENEPASRRKPADPAHHATHRLAGEILADALPDHDGGTRGIEARGAQQAGRNRRFRNRP